ncbi:MAG: hypothetical protein U5L45_13470 [Saprospiraceae bacterium]|nr:hypothetical protein [Saprospiraceae bacterium]
MFKKFPPTVICGGEPLNFDHSATDTEGHQMVYEFCQPLGGGNKDPNNGCSGVTPNPPCNPPYSDVIFATGYDYLKPMGGDPLVKIDRNTGLITGTPNVLGQFVVGVSSRRIKNSGKGNC